MTELQIYRITELQNYRFTDLQNYRITEGQTGQIQYSPTFSKRGYNKNVIFILLLLKT